MLASWPIFRKDLVPAACTEVVKAPLATGEESCFCMSPVLVLHAANASGLEFCVLSSHGPIG